MLAFGVVLIFQSSKSLNGIGYILAGLGFLFLGIHYMKDGFEAFKDTINLAEYAVAGYPGVLLFTAIGIFATVVMQSSHATLVLTITALAAGQIAYENALALAIGANVGTTITAILGAMSANENGKRLAVAHLIFNSVTGVHGESEWPVGRECSTVAAESRFQLLWSAKKRFTDDKVSIGASLARVNRCVGRRFSTFHANDQPWTDGSCNCREHRC